VCVATYGGSDNASKIELTRDEQVNYAMLVHGILACGATVSALNPDYQLEVCCYLVVAQL
jgi:hypothetical protein